MKLVCLGDSLTYGYGVRRSEAWPALLANRHKIEVLNKGVNGDATAGMLSRFYRDVVLQKPSHVFIMGGGNDLMWEAPLFLIKANIASMVQQSFHEGILPILGVQTPIPAEMAEKNWGIVKSFTKVNEGLEEYTEWIYEYARNFKLKVIDFYKPFINEDGSVKKEYYLDGLHLTPEGNMIMADCASSVLGLE